MKTKYFAALAIAATTIAFSGCASTSERTSSNSTYPVNKDLSERRVYTQEQLKKTGRTNAAEGLEALDPSVRAHGGR